MTMKVYDGEGMILGRLAARAAKDVLLGEEVAVVNCEKIIVSGKTVNTFAAAKQKYDRRGYPLKSAKVSRLPDRYVRRVIRGMLPWKQSRGKAAFRRVMCYKGIPDTFKAESEAGSLITLPDAAATKLPLLQKTTVEEICRHLGRKA